MRCIVFVLLLLASRLALACPAAICILALSGLIDTGLARTVSIANGTLKATYDETSGTFSLRDKASGLIFIKEGKLGGPIGRAFVESGTDPLFNSGRRINLNCLDGGKLFLELYEGLPFLLIRGELRNPGPALIDVTNISPAAFTLDLGQPGRELRTMGTAGLTAPEQNPGSYLFLTLADPATRRGIVAGWLTADRGCGVIFSEVSAAKGIQFKTRIDYGRLCLEAGESSKTETLAVGLFEDARIGQELFAQALARQYNIRLRPEPTGYCTWYSSPHGGAADEKSITELAEFVAK